MGNDTQTSDPTVTDVSFAASSTVTVKRFPFGAGHFTVVLQPLSDLPAERVIEFSVGGIHASWTGRWELTSRHIAEHQMRDGE